MRDIVLSLFLIGALPAAFVRPFIGAVIFAWLGIMNPHRMTWGFAYDVSWAQMYALATIAGMLVSKDKLVADSLWRYRFVLIYVAWMCITTAFAIEQASALTKLIEILKVQTMCFVTLCLLTSRAKVEILAALSTLSIAFFGVKGGLFTLRGGGADRVWGPPESILTDNNHLAAGLVVALPLVYWMVRRVERRWLQWGLIAAMLLIAASILGSYSRSAFLGLCAMALFLFFKSDRKLAVAPLVLTGALVASVVMPDKYWARIESIGTYEEDSSTTGRLNAWETAFNVANARITGAGFEYYKPTAFALYAPNPLDIHSSHSIYFQALGEHGWVGLVLFLSIWISIWIACWLARKCLPQTREGRSLDLLVRMIQVSLVGFAVSGGFLNIGNWDFMYYLATIALAVQRLSANRQLEGRPLGEETPPAVAAGLQASNGRPAMPARLGSSVRVRTFERR